MNATPKILTDDVYITMVHKVIVTNEYAHDGDADYPPEVTDSTGVDQLLAIARFDAENGDEPVETYAASNEILAVSMTAPTGVSYE